MGHVIVAAMRLPVTMVTPAPLMAAQPVRLLTFTPYRTDPAARFLTDSPISKHATPRLGKEACGVVTGLRNQHR